MKKKKLFWMIKPKKKKKKRRRKRKKLKFKKTNWCIPGVSFLCNSITFKLAVNLLKPVKVANLRIKPTFDAAPFRAYCDFTAKVSKGRKK